MRVSTCARGRVCAPGSVPSPVHVLRRGAATGIGPTANRAVAVLREQGLREVYSKIRARFGVDRVVVYELKRERVLQRAASPEGVTVRAIAEADIAAYAALHPNSYEVAVARLRKGERCLAAWREGRIVGTRWLTTTAADLGWGIVFPMCPGIAYAYDAFTAPAERGRGIGATVTAALVEEAFAAGAKRVINAVLPSNPDGQALARGRSELLGELSSAHVGRWLIVRCRVPRGYLGAPRSSEP